MSKQTRNPIKAFFMAAAFGLMAPAAAAQGWGGFMGDLQKGGGSSTPAMAPSTVLDMGQPSQADYTSTNRFLVESAGLQAVSDAPNIYGNTLDKNSLSRISDIAMRVRIFTGQRVGVYGIGSIGIKGGDDISRKIKRVTDVIDTVANGVGILNNEASKRVMACTQQLNAQRSQIAYYKNNFTGFDTAVDIDQRNYINELIKSGLATGVIESVPLLNGYAVEFKSGDVAMVITGASGRPVLLQGQQIGVAMGTALDVYANTLQHPALNPKTCNTKWKWSDVKGLIGGDMAKDIYGIVVPSTTTPAPPINFPAGPIPTDPRTLFPRN